ncbi:hypothetical protein [Vibrio rarus]|uniref:hypothetical protein n=1 Tax=Vibrio rarus TaxID=413403 RepID=UPI0021C4ADBC|nr:hypothetical protein [Vibrio rarus]
MTHKLTTLLVVALLSIPTSNVYADEVELSEFKVADNNTLSTLRGGFQLANDYIVDIGISISAAINGKNIYQTTIANLVFQNGNLAVKTPSNNHESNLVTVVQVGDGNIIEEGVITSPESLSTEQTPTPPVTAPSNIISVIQNTLDDSVIGINTVVDIDARVESVNKQIRDDLRLKGALLNHHY